MKQLELFEPETLWMSKDYLILQKYYPHIADAIAYNWKEPLQIINFLEKLLLSTREDTRKGFPPEHAACILNLIELRKKLQNDESKEN